MRQLLAAGVVFLVVGTTAVLVVVANGSQGDGSVASTTLRSSSSTRIQDVLPGSDQLRKGDVEGARAAILAHIKANPDDLQARFLLAMTYEREGDPAGAIQVYQQITKTDERNFEAYFRMAQLQAAEKRQAEAITSLEKALELNPDFTAARVALAELSADTGDGDRAVKLYYEVIEARPMGTHLDQIRTALAAQLIKVNQPENAVIQLQKALAENPDNLDARRLLDKVRPGTPTLGASTTGVGATTSTTVPAVTTTT